MSNEKKTYFYTSMDEGKAFFDTPEKLLEHIKNNTSDEETIEVGCEELTATEWERLSGPFSPIDEQVGAT